MDFSSGSGGGGSSTEPESYTCNICCEEFTEKKVILACNPKHIFCYDCILDWYKKKSGVVGDSYSSYGSSNGNGGEDRTCPICRKDGGFLKIPPELANQNKLPGIHIEKAINFKTNPYAKCDCINHNSYDVVFPCASSVYCAIQCYDGEYKTKIIHICWHHYHVARKGGQLTLQDGGGTTEKPLYTLFQRTPCQIKTNSGSQCSGNCNMAKSGTLQSVMVGNYGEVYVCNKHKTDYEKGKTLALFGAGSDHPLRSFSKNGLSSSSTSSSTGSPSDLPAGACGEKLKNGGYCKRIGKEVYCGKCAAHKPSSSMTIVTGTKLENTEDHVPLKVPKIDINKFVHTWNMLHDTLETLKETVNKAEFDHQIKELEGSLSRIHQHITCLKFDAYEENAIVCEEIETECSLFCHLLNAYKGDDGLIPTSGSEVVAPLPVAKVSEAKVSEAKAQEKSGPRKTRYVLVDLFKLRSSSYCNVRLENGKLCGMPGNKYSHMKCSRHRQEHYNKEFFHDAKTDLFVRDLSPEELEKILEKKA